MTRLTVNGVAHDLDVDPATPLLWVLREVVGLTGTKYGCGIALCGACTVHVDGQPTRSCATPASAVAGKKIVTVERIGQSPAGKAVQAAWVAENVPQCGYCQSGQVMSAVALLTEKKKPSDTEIDDAMSGNLCRCATYHRIRGAIHEAAKLLEA